MRNIITINTFITKSLVLNKLDGNVITVHISVAFPFKLKLMTVGTDTFKCHAIFALNIEQSGWTRRFLIGNMGTALK